MKAAAALLKWCQTAAVLLEGHMQVGMISPIGVIGVAMWSISRWLIFTQDMGMLLH